MVIDKVDEKGIRMHVVRRNIVMFIYKKWLNRVFSCDFLVKQKGKKNYLLKNFINFFGTEERKK